MKPKTAEELGIRQVWLTKNRHRSQTDNWIVTTPWATMRFEKESDAFEYFKSMPKSSNARAYFILDDGRAEDLTEDYEFLLYKPEPVKEHWFQRLMHSIGL